MALQLNLLELSEKTKNDPVIAGTDEAGRGCLAGPVVAAAVILPNRLDLPGLGDSKRLSPTTRSRLALSIKSQNMCYGIGIVWPGVIDKINILQASLFAMASAFCRLKRKVDILYIDGNSKIPERYFADFHGLSIETIPVQKTVIHGDALIPCISAASILAKTCRDRIMERLDKKWPQYGFAQHKGYGTKKHLEALRKSGSCLMHRQTFRGVVSSGLDNSFHLL